MQPRASRPMSRATSSERRGEATSAEMTRPTRSSSSTGHVAGPCENRSVPKMREMATSSAYSSEMQHAPEAMR